MADSPWVVDVNYENFQEEVVERSKSLPVVVDFWAEWCGPCRALGPVLETLAAEKNGQFLLAKINTDNCPDLAQAFQVNGIPAVFAVRHGKMVKNFEGVLPESEVRSFLDEVIGAPADAASTALELEGRDPSAAIKAYRDLLATEPGNFAARVGLARVLLAGSGHEAEAAELLAGVDVGDDAEEAERLRTVVALRDLPHSESDLSSAMAAVSKEPTNAASHLQLGQILAARGEYISALDTLLAAADEDRTLGRSTIRELMVRIFTVIGARSPEADEYRRKLQNILY